MKRIFHDIDQVEAREEWLSLRLGRATASNFKTIMANDGKAFGEPAKKYSMRIALEAETHTQVEDNYVNAAMQRGIDLEPLAREQYEMDSLVEVQNGGFLEAGYYGGSADGLVGEDGLIEIKSVGYPAHFERWVNGGFDSAYKWQLQGNIWLYDRKWIDFVSYCPEFPLTKNLYVCRVDRDEDMIDRLKVRLAAFLIMVDKYKEALR